jgi:MFS family permease
MRVSSMEGRPKALIFNRFWVFFGLYALMGATDASLGVSWNTLLSQHNLASSQLAVALFLGTAAALPLFWCGGKWLEGRDKRSALLLAVVLVLLSSGLALFASSSWALLIAAFWVVPSVALLELGSSSSVLEHKQAMGRVHSGFAVGAVAGAALTGFLSSHHQLEHMMFFLLLLAIPLVYGVLKLPRAATRVTLARGIPARVTEKSPLLTLIAPIVVVVAFAEGVMLSWSGLFFERELHLSAAQSGTLSGVYYLAFGVGAFLSSSLLQKLSHRTALSLLGALATLGGLILALSSSAPLATGGLLLLGFSLAGMLPTLLEWAGFRIGLGAAGLVGTFAYAGMLLEPLLASLYGEHLRVLFLGIPLLMAVGTLALVFPQLERMFKPARGVKEIEVGAAWD